MSYCTRCDGLQRLTAHSVPCTRCGGTGYEPPERASPQPDFIGLDLSSGPDLVGVHCVCGRDHTFTPAEVEASSWIACACGIDLRPALR